MAVAGTEVRGGSPPLLRKGVPGERRPLKEKLIAYYELIFEVTPSPMVTLLSKEVL